MQVFAEACYPSHSIGIMIPPRLSPLSEVEDPVRDGELEMLPLRRAWLISCMRFSLTLILFGSPSASLPALFVRLLELDALAILLVLLVLCKLEELLREEFLKRFMTVVGEGAWETSGDPVGEKISDPRGDAVPGDP